MDELLQRANQRSMSNPLTHWLRHLREEMNSELHQEDGWLRYYFLGIYSTIPLEHQQWIISQRDQSYNSHPRWLIEYIRHGIITDQAIGDDSRRVLRSRCIY